MNNGGVGRHLTVECDFPSKHVAEQRMFWYELVRRTGETLSVGLVEQEPVRSVQVSTLDRRGEGARDERLRDESAAPQMKCLKRDAVVVAGDESGDGVGREV
jgi:hypothetical protein